jgi:hypothetical protein
MRYSAWFSLIVGLLMFGQWGFFLATGQVPELQTEPMRIIAHLIGEFLTAILLMIGGIAYFKKNEAAKNLLLVAAGMLFYTIIVSPGYFAQLGQWPIVGMFVLLVGLNLVNLFYLFKFQRN